MILDTPAAERTIPTTKAIIPRVAIDSVIPEKPKPDLIVKKDKIARVGVNADAENFLRDVVSEIEAIVRNRMGKEMTSTVKNPATHNAVLETIVPATAPKGKATMRRNHDRISIPMSLRKFRTLSLRRMNVEFRASPMSVGITTPINGKNRIPRKRAPVNGRATTDVSAARVRKTETTSEVDGKRTLRMKLNAPTVPPTPVVVFWVTTIPLGASHRGNDTLHGARTLLFKQSSRHNS